MVDASALRADGAFAPWEFESPSRHLFGDEFDGRMPALGAGGTGSNSLVPD